MARIPAILRLSPKLSLASNTAFFAKAVARAAAKPPPPPPNPPLYASPQVTTPVQRNGGNTTFHPVQATNSTPFPGYGVYSPEYLQQLELASESPVYGPTVPENFDSPSFDPLNRDDIFLPVDNVTEEEPVIDEEAIEQAEGLAADIAEGRGLDHFDDADLDRDAVIEQLEAGGYEVEVGEWGLAGDNITRTTITDPETGETIQEFYDHDTDRSWVKVVDEDGEELSTSDVRDDEGRKVTVSEDEESGERTTRFEDDLGDGSVIEITELPNSDVVTITTTDSDGNSETVVVAEDGTRTTLDPEQDTSREGIDGIVEGVADGQSIDEIAEEQGLTREQVIAQLEAAGFEFESGAEGQGPNYTNTTRITDAVSGDLIVSHETGPDGTKTSHVIDADGNETRRTEHADGSTTEVVTEPDGRETETTVDADGKTTTTVTYEQNGVMVEDVIDDDGKTTTTIIDEEGNRTGLGPEQETTREGIDEIAEGVSEGKNLDQIAEERGLTREQVIAQLRAAGYEVEFETDELSSGGEQYTIKIVDAEDGEEVIASYSAGRGAGNSSIYIDAEGNEVSRTEYGNGTVIEIVIEVDGRKTKTTTVVENNGEAIEHDVEQGEYLIAIAERYGVTLEELKESNPELFDSPRDPNIIHEGETLVIENATQTTVEVTHNGYTLITPPDGDRTLRCNEDGTEVTVERGTPLEAMVETLLAVTLDSDDAEEARVAEVVLAAVEGMLAGEVYTDLNETIEEQQQALDEASKEYGSGQQPDRNVTYDDPYGDPPLEPPPSGGDWVPMYGLWMDPEVARATAALNASLAEQLRIVAEFERSQTQLNVFALDPAYEEALQRAGNLFDEALAPQGLVWVPPEPEGTLEDAREQLEGAETRLEAAGEAMEEYQEAERLLGEAISAQGEMPDLPSGGVCTSEDSPVDLQIMADEYEREQSTYEAAQANVDALFFEANLHSTKGDSRLADYRVSLHESQLAAADPDSDAYAEIELALEEAEELQGAAENQVGTAQAYHDLYAARRDASQLTVDAYDLRDQLLEVFNEDKGLLEEGKTFSRVNGKYLGEFTGQQVIEEGEDGLWVVTHFEKGTTRELLAPEEMSEWWEKNRDPEITVAWLELGDSRQTGHERVAEASAALHRTLETNYDIALDNLDDEIADLEAELELLFERHGPGASEAPDALFPVGTEPEEVELGDQVLLVTPDMAAAFEEGDLEAVKASDQPIGIVIDGELRWVHAEIALTHAALEIARDEEPREALEHARDAVGEAAARHELFIGQPMQRLGESDSAYEARLWYDLVEEQGDEALDPLFQANFQELHEQGFDTTFRPLGNKGLDSLIEDTFGLKKGADGYGDVLDAIHDIGGDRPETRAVPLLHLDREGGTSQVMLVAVRNNDGEIRYVDATGKHYADLADFQDHNRQFGEEDRLVVPQNLEMRPGEDGIIPLEVVTARNVSVQEKIVDPLVGIGTGVATVLAFTPAAPVAAPLAYLGSAYLGYRAFEYQRNHMQRGGSWNDLESGMNYLSIATTFLPAGASGLRTIGMARSSSLNMTKGEAFLASIGAVKPNSTLAANANTYMRSADGLNRWARGADWGAIATGVPLMGVSGYQLAVNGDQMSGLQQIDAVVGLSTGFVGTGLGIYGLRTTRPPRATRETGGPPPDGQPPAGRGDDTPSPTPDVDASGGSTMPRPTTDETQGGQGTPAPGEAGDGAPPTENAHDSPVFSDHASRDEASQTVAAAIEGRAEQAALFDTQTEATPPPPRPTASRPDSRLRGNMGPFVFRADTRPPTQIETAGGFHPREPTGIWVDNPQGISLSNYVLGNTPGRFVGTSGSVEGVKSFVSQESLAASKQGHTFVYILNPSRERLHVPGEFDTMGRPVSDHMRQVDEMAIDGSIPWHEVLGWRQVDPNGNFVGEFVRNPAYQGGSAAAISAPEPRRYYSEEAGKIIADQVYGPYPKSEEHIYVQPEGAPAERGDSPAVADKTHILHRDPETGERILMPWIRGAAKGHEPSQQGQRLEGASDPQQRLTKASVESTTTQAAAQVRSMTPEAEGLARVYRLEDIEALNRASNDGALPPGYYVHLIRTPELDTGTFTLQRGTVPRSGVVDDGGHFQWPSGREVNVANRDGRIHAVVSELSASQIRERFRSGEGLPFAVYSGNGLWSMASNLSANNPHSPTTAEKPSQITQPPETTQKNTPEQQVPPATVENQQPRSQGSSETPQRKSRSEKVIGSILVAAGAAGVSLSTHPLADAIAFATRGASLTVRSLLPNHTKVDQFWGRVLRGLEFWTLSVNLPGSASAVMQGSNVDINLPYAAGHLAYIIKNYVEATTGKPFAPYTDDVALPLYLAGSVPYTTSSLRGGDHGAFVDATGAAGGGLFVVGSALLWVQGSATWQKGVKPIITKLWPVRASSTQRPQENSTLPGMNGQSEASSQKNESKLKPTFTTPLTYGIGLGLFSASSAAVAWSNSRNEKEDDLDVDEVPTIEPPSDDENGREVDEAPTVEPPSGDENGREVDEAPTVEPPSGDENGHEDKGPVLEPLGGNERGRFNLELEHRGHDWVEAESHLSLGGIAISRGYDVAELVEFNLGHIRDPGTLYPGDRIYLPKRELA